MKTSNFLNISLIQTDIIWENPQANREYLSEKIKQVKLETDLVILPEMFTTGFTMNVDLAETMEGETVNWMQNIATEKQIAITGSIIIKEQNNYHNRLLFIFPNGKIEYYDKRHSFSYGNEHETFTAGSSKLILTYKGWKICPLICYDLRFPVWARNTENYDLLIYVASWPEKRIYAWDTLLKARAIENLSYTIGVNRIGEDGKNYNYVGHSIALDFLGKSISKEHCSIEKVIEISLDKSLQNEKRHHFGFLNDKDQFSIN